jgi:hypothetical protein
MNFFCRIKKLQYICRAKTEVIFMNIFITQLTGYLPKDVSGSPVRRQGDVISIFTPSRTYLITNVTPGNRSAATCGASVTPGNRPAATCRTSVTPGNRSAATCRTSVTPGNRSAATCGTSVTPGNRPAAICRTSVTPGNRSAATCGASVTPGNRSVATCGTTGCRTLYRRGAPRLYDTTRIPNKNISIIKTESTWNQQMKNW